MQDTMFSFDRNVAIWLKIRAVCCKYLTFNAYMYFDPFFLRLAKTWHEEGDLTVSGAPRTIRFAFFSSHEVQ